MNRLAVLMLAPLLPAMGSCIAAPARAWVAPAACTASPVAAVAPPGAGPRRTRNLVLVTIDGTRWQEIFQGVDPERAADAQLPAWSARQLLPHIYERLVDRGVALGAPGHGAPVVASGPAFASLPGYQELLGGHPATSCGGNGCAPIARPTLLDRVRDELAVPAAEVVAISSWERMERATAQDNRAITLSAGRHHGPTRDRLRVSGCAGALLDQAAEASPAPGHADYRPDAYTAALALEVLRNRQPRLLFVGLGDTDEHGHAHDYAAYVESLRAVDRFIGALFAELDRRGAEGDTTVILTTDHGWSDSFYLHGAWAPESRRVWLLAAGGAVPVRGFVDAAHPVRLADVAPTAFALLGGVPPDAPGDGQPIAELLPPSLLLSLR